MSPSQSNDHHLSRRDNGGLRPSPLNISKDSRTIHKPSSSSSVSSLSSSSSLAVSITKQHQPQRHPVIIYTHSPKIIRTEARDFMALVQKLTGMSQPDADAVAAPAEPKPVKVENSTHPLDANRGMGIIGPTPFGTDHENHAIGDIHASSSSVSSVLDVQNPSPFFSDVPLFTPNSTEFFCTSGQYYRYPDSVFPTANVASSMSAPAMEVLKPYPDYLN